uniref:protein HESO1-like n=1 Tax=Erigeron canadensis TaxID=72917 RepID=UPI001CB95029|nr:protein HESO1-like [Erigeron canadensis]
MALKEKVLKKKAEKFELKELEKITLNQASLSVLDKLLNDAYKIRRPKPSEYEDRRQVIRVFNEIARELYGDNASCPVVEEFGSFSMDLFTTGSDLDLSVNFRNGGHTEFPRDQKIRTLRKFARKFYSLQTGGYVQGVQPIMSAKVPILKVVDPGTGVECDLSVENRDGISKSAMIRFITSIDERFLKLSFLMKAWAKAHNINSSKDRTLNSLSIILLVAFHLQTRDPPILPPFSAILKGGQDLVSVQNSVRNFQNYGRKNTETLGELFVSFFLKLSSVKNLWPKGLCASPYQGHWISKTWDTKIATMSVEDFTDRTQNVARAVGKSEVGEIYGRIHLTIENLCSFMNGQIEASLLNVSFFGIDRMHHHPFVLQPNIYKENGKLNQHIMTTNPVLAMNKVSNSNGVVDQRNSRKSLKRATAVGDWGGTHHQTIAAVLNTLGAVQPVDHQPTKRLRGEQGVPSTKGWQQARDEPRWNQGGGGAAEVTGWNRGWGAATEVPRWNPGWGGATEIPRHNQSWGGAREEPSWDQGWRRASTGGWARIHGAASQELRHSVDLWGQKLQ